MLPFRFLYKLFEHLQRLSLRKHGVRILVPRTTRLLRRFSVNFLTSTEDRRYLQIGENCILNAAFTFESASGLVTIGDRVYMGANTSVIARNSVIIGNDVTFAWGVMVYDHNSHSIDWRQRARVVEHFFKHYGSPTCFSNLDWSDVASAPIVISDRAWIGFEAVILKGVTIGEGAIVGARSVVTRDVEPYTIVAGNPAELVRRISTNE